MNHCGWGWAQRSCLAVRATLVPGWASGGDFPESGPRAIMFWGGWKERGEERGGKRASFSTSDWLTAMAASQSGSTSDHLCPSVPLSADPLLLAESIAELLRFPLIYCVPLDSRDRIADVFCKRLNPKVRNSWVHSRIAEMLLLTESQ